MPKIANWSLESDGAYFIKWSHDDGNGEIVVRDQSDDPSYPEDDLKWVVEAWNSDGTDYQNVAHSETKKGAREEAVDYMRDNPGGC